MSAPIRELFANQATTILDGAINNSVTSIDVIDASVFPATGSFRLLCENEIMQVTAVSGDTLTVVRGTENTTGASHADSEPIALHVTAGALDQWITDSIPLALYKRPLGKIVNDAGDAELVVADFTWVNQGSATATDQNGTILMRAPTDASTNVRALELTAPSTPYAYICAFHFCGPMAGTDDNVHFLFGFRESSTSKITMLVYGASSEDEPNRIAVHNYTDSDTFLANVRAMQSIGFIGSELWLRIEDDGTDLTFSQSGDGVNWADLVSVGRTAHMAGGPNRVFWGLTNADNPTNECIGRLLHWSLE